MDQTLMVSALLMGLAGTPHCLAMCGAACGLVTGGRTWSLGAFHFGRLLAYAAAGALAAASMGTLAQVGQAAAALRPFWTLVHMAALVLGVYLVWRGRQPAWMESMGRVRRPAQTVIGPSSAWQALRLPARSGMVAALANTPASGAAVMAAFAVASGLGLAIGPKLWWRLTGATGNRMTVSPALAVRLAGLALAAASAWALGHGLWMRVWAWCVA
jgi:hypothetical protein